MQARTKHRDDAEVVCAIVDRVGDESAVRLGTRMSECLGAGLVLVDVQPPPPPPAGFMGVAGPGLMTPAAPVLPVPADIAEPSEPPPAEWEERLVLPPGTRREHVAAPPAEALRMLSERPSTCLLVAGDHGGGPLSTVFAGNPGRDACRHAACPVVLVPHGASPPALRDVVCGIDDDDSTAAVSAFAAGLALDLGGHLWLVHARPHPIAGPTEAVDADELQGYDREAFDVVRAAARRALPPEAPARFRAYRGDPPDALRMAAADLGAGFIVIGRPAHGVVGSMLLGSAAHDLLRDVGTPVVVVPAHHG